ncbi:hypothetical protein BEN47_00150 [Hymenobacter lapidarius]|uniref:Histidine phosphatase family protein n=1 Tax=Hymenobacter lapidarius TaxID=1908237 RepID=A0A1G1T9T3_9BACT|nr:hypothetical protein BEN47_00150 [Hymenobacter lapidarius]
MFLLTGLAALLGSSACRAQVPVAAGKGKAKASLTTIYLMRHGEKDTIGNPADPALTAVGQARAQALRQLLARKRPTAIFTTDTKRTRATVAPLAAAVKVEPEVYNAKETTALAQRLRRDYVGKTVVVVGHSNTLLPLIESLGGTPPVEEIGDNEYDYLFTVRIAEGVLPVVEVRGYGPERKVEGAPKAARMR